MASGPLSFMKGYDAFAGVIKSGGKTRRAAKMVILNIDHPDVEKFVWCKAKEEKKAHTLIDAGYDSSLDGEAYGSIFFQNANNSVRATDDFMEAVVKDGDKTYVWVVRDARVERREVVLMTRLNEDGEVEITVADQHVATAVSEYVLSRLYTRFPMDEPLRGAAVVACARTEAHQTGAHIVADAQPARPAPACRVPAAGPARFPPVSRLA